MTKVKWGILAPGNIAKAFARGVKASATGELVAVGSRSQEKADKFADEFGIPTRHASYESLLADPNVQAVYVSTPHPWHAEWAIKAAEAGKHVLCEKPMGINAPEVMAIIEAAQRNKVFLMEAFMYRNHPQIAKMIEIIKSGAIGDVRLIQSTFGFNANYKEGSRILDNELGGGGILDVGCYPVSIARLIAGVAIGKDIDEPTEVKGSGKLHPTQRTDEWAAATLKFASGIVAQVATSVQINQDNVTRIYGSKGSILLTDPWIPSRTGETCDIVVTTDGKPQTITIEPGKPLYALEADCAGNAILAGKTQAESPAMSWADSLGQAHALDAWRHQIGLVYDLEKPDAPQKKVTVANRPLRPSSRVVHKMKYGQIPGVTKPMSRLVMGVDNQATIAHASVMFDDFMEQGGNVFDTGFIYMGGNSEKLLGQWVRNRGVREEVVLLDKGAHTPFCDPVSLTKQFLTSIERLGTDYVDIYMMHRDNPQVPVGEFIDAMNEHISAGRMRAIGGSNWSIERVEAANAYAKKNGKVGFSAISNNFSLARMVEPPWAGCIAASTPEYKQWLTANNMAIMPWSSQARGFFLDDTSPSFTADAERVRCWFSEDNFERLKRARELAKKYGVSAINIALAYVLCQPFPTFPLIGPRQLSETRTSLPGLSVELSADEVQWLDLAKN